MAGFSRIYCIGGEGGFQGADGINPLVGQVLVGDGNRQWLEPVYVQPDLGPLGSVRNIIPAGPGHPDMLLDACIAFFPRLLGDCPSMKVVAGQLGDAKQIDFDLRKNVPAAWAQLRAEAKPGFSKLGIWEAILKQVQ